MIIVYFHGIIAVADVALWRAPVERDPRLDGLAASTKRIEDVMNQRTRLMQAPSVAPLWAAFNRPTNWFSLEDE